MCTSFVINKSKTLVGWNLDQQWEHIQSHSLA